MNNDPQRPGEQDCPKRLWVLLTLSDDELLGRDGRLPRGLQFHLSRCDSCRSVADRLLSTSGVLRAMSELEPNAALAEAANAQALAALGAGAKLTGRVDIPDEADPALRRTTPLQWLRFGRFAAAAAVFVAVSLFGFSYVRRQDDGATDYRPGRGPLAGRSTGHVERADQPRETPRPGDAAPLPIEPQGETAGARLVEGGEAGPVRRRVRRICRHHSYVRAAMTDDPDGAQPAHILPDTTHRNLGWGRLFDRSRTPESTKVGKQKR